MNKEEMAVQHIAFVIALEKLSSKHELIPPIEVRGVDFDGRHFKFYFNPAFDSLELPFTQRTPPIILHFRDAVGKVIEEQITDLNLESESEETVCAQNTEGEI